MRLFGIVDRICGYYRAVFPADQAERVANSVFRRGVPHGEFKRLEDGSLTFRVSRKAARELRDIIDKSGFVGYSLYGKGLPFFIRRYRKRAGFFAGALIFAAISYISTLFIWRVEVISDTALNKTTVEKNLSLIGVKPGAYIPACDFWALSTEYLTTFDDCAWLSVNMSGTVAQIELREKLGRDGTADDAPCNVVAADGGVIDSLVIRSGRGYVTPGTVVKQGDLLVSGVIEDIQGSYRLTGADAEVYAEIERVITVDVAYSHSFREYTGEERSACSLSFFGAETDLLFGDRDPGEGWEKSVDRASPVLPDGKPLPVSIGTVRWREYFERKLEYTPEEARALAKARLDRAISEQLPEARILSVIKTTEQTESGVRAEARVRCICDIAAKHEIILEVQTGE